MAGKSIVSGQPEWFRNKQKVLKELHSFLSKLLDDKGGGGGISSPEPPPENPGEAKKPEPSFDGFEPGLKAGTVPFRLEGPKRPPQDLKDISAWGRWLVEKVREDGPWEKRELDAILQAHSLDMFTRISIIRQAIGSGLLIARGSVIWHNEADTRLVSVKVSGNKQRDFGCYSDEELLRALELSCAEVGSMPGDELARFTTRFLGLPRTTKAIRSRIESLIAQAIDEGYLVGDRDTYRAGALWRRYVALPRGALYTVTIPKAHYKSPAQISKVAVGPSTGLSARPRLSVRQLILAAYNEKRALKVQYRNASGYSTERVVQILGVGTNYIDAFDSLRNEPRTFRIDRIVKAELTDDKYRLSKVYVPSQWVAARH